jgi:hypothetical protein
VSVYLQLEGGIAFFIVLGGSYAVTYRLARWLLKVLPEKGPAAKFTTNRRLRKESGTELLLRLA